MELDIYLPKERLAFEYQGEQHYYDIYALGNLWVQKEKDKEKRKACKDHGITLIEVPYWWEFDKSSLMATIHERAPQFVPKGEGLPIPIEPPNGFPKGLVPELMNAEEWDGKEDLKGWWISEKMDGVRAVWNGKKLISRNAHEIMCPEWFIDGLPEGIQLEGELWMGRRKLEKTVTTLKTKSHESWKEIKFVIFDTIVDNKPYEKRMAELQNLSLSPFASVVELKICLGNDDLMNRLNAIVADGGEGIVVTKPDSLYLPQRTKSRLKVKVRKSKYLVTPEQLHHDSEVQLLEIVSSGFFCLQTNGMECIVGCEKSVFDSPPEIGSILTVKHSGYYNNGTLRHPFYWRQRVDIQWNGISSQTRELFSSAIWTRPENCKKFFSHVKAVRQMNMEDFYKMTPEDVAQFGGKAMLEHVFDKSLAKALQFVYPDHPWSWWRFQQPVPNGFWDNKQNQRSFMDWLGLELGFKQMEDWYTLSSKDVMDHRGGALFVRHSQSASKIVVSVFPEHQWDLSKFPSKYWLDKVWRANEL